MSQLKIYTASAGSGKTFQLVYEFLLIVFKKPQEFRHILAVTFTNKSTAEMKERIISDLQKLSKGEDPGYRASLMQELNATEVQIKQQAQLILTKILHHYGYLSITTIDRFFQKLIRSFARDINLSSVYDVELDTDAVMKEVIDQLIEDADKNERTFQHISAFTRHKIEEGKAWDLRKDLIDFGKNVFSEKFQLIEIEKYTAIFEDEKALLIYKDIWQNVVDQFENDLAALGNKALHLIQLNHLIPADFSGGKNAAANFFVKLKKKETNYNDYFFKPAITKAMENPEAWSSKTSPKKNEIAAIGSQLSNIAKEAHSLLNERNNEYTTALTLLKNFYQFTLIIDILNTLKNYRDENDLMLISDAANLITKIMNGDQESFVFEKMGALYHHFLIDEFQDTSTLQWENFYPLIRNSISQNYLSLIVGDVKQSIYRFRNGDWNLLLSKVENDYFPGETYKKPLDTNWRSSQKVIEFNNTIFDFLPRIISERYTQSIKENPLEEKAREFAAIFPQAYENHRQLFSPKSASREGFVQIDFFALPENSNRQAEREEEETETDSDLILERIHHLLQNLAARGYAQRDIAILVKRNNEATAISSYFGALPDNKFQFITESSLKLGEAHVIQFILSALQYMLDPKNRIYESHLRYIYARYILKINVANDWETQLKRSEENIPEAIQYFYSQLDSLKNFPVYDITERIIAIFSLQNNAEDLPYIQAFQDAIIEFYKRSNVSLPNFIEWWQTGGNKKSIKLSESQNAIRIMTIHKSKGLQFPITIIPFANWEFDHRSKFSPTLWVDTRKKSQEDNSLVLGLPIYPVKYEPALINSIFAEDYLEERQANFLDQLNNFYVACTRPEEELYIITSYQKTKSEASVKENLNSYLQEVIFSMATLMQKTEDTDNLQSYTTGQKTHKKNSVNKQDESEFTLSHYEVGHGNMKMKLPSSAIVTKEITHGKLVHQILSEITHLKDAETILESYRLEKQATDDVRKILEEPQVKQWFSDDADVFLEQPILQKNGIVSIPDRVVILQNEAIIIDFKTGAPNTKYHKQLQSYKDALYELGYEKVRAAILYITNLEIVQI